LHTVTSAFSPAMRMIGIRRIARLILTRIAISTGEMIALRLPERGAGVGATVGGTAGLLAGLGIIAIPGVGPVVAAGWLVATLAGAAAGGATGSIIGALTQAGVGKDEAEVYAEGLRRGGAVVSARVKDSEGPRLQALMDREAVDVAERRAAYRQGGWKSFDPGQRPYTADQIRRERDLYMRR
jgi:hypothetical protein